MSRSRLYAAGLPFGDSCTRTEPCGRRVYGFGGSSSSSSASTTSSTTAIDGRLVTDGNSQGISANGSRDVTVTMSDAGANKLADYALQVGGYLGYNGMALASDAVTKAMEQSNAVAKMAMIQSSELTSSAAALFSADSAANSANFAHLIDATSILANNAFGTMAANTALAKDLNSASQTAYAGAASQAAGNKNIVMVGMVVVGLAAIMVFWKK